jgi:ribosomal protein S18 acetylase RimI-like enzyme
MRITYFKRYKMEVDLRTLPAVELPAGYQFVPWSLSLLETHAEILYQSFHGEVDSIVFASLGDRLGCAVLMSEIARKPGFEPLATWLLWGPQGPCGSVQGLRDHHRLGAIQNLGILPASRGQGLGTLLLLRALHGFRQSGLGRGLLEVTAQNDTAIRLYRRLGFVQTKALYKAVPERQDAISYV